MRRAPLPRFALVAAASRSNEEIVADLAAVAEEHAPEGGYGETAWNAEEGKVFWQHADWTGTEEHDAADAAFRAVDGVREFGCDAEGGLPYDYEAEQPLEGWEIVWPEGMTAAAPRPAPVAVPVAEDAPNGLLKTAMDALLALANKPSAPVPDVHVHVGSPDLSVKVEPAQTHVHMPEQPAPEVHLNVEAPAAPPPPPAPDVHVTVEAAPAPDVHVEVAPPPPADVHVQVDVPRPRPIRVEEYDDGTRRYVPEEELDGEG